MRDSDIHCAAARRVTHGDFERKSFAKRVASDSSDSVPNAAVCATLSSTGTGTDAEASRAVSPGSPKSKASAMEAQHSASSASAIAAATPRSDGSNGHRSLSVTEVR